MYIYIYIYIYLIHIYIIYIYIYICIYILKATESFEVMKNANVLKFAVQRDKLLPNIFSTDTPEENI